MDEGRWKWLAIGSAALAMLLGLVQLWDRIWTPSGKLVGTVTYSSLSYPPPLFEALGVPRKLAERDALRKAAGTTTKPRGMSEQDWSDALDSISLEIYSYLNSQLPLVTSLNGAFVNSENVIYRGSWVAVVRNDGSRTLAKVRLYLPGSTLVLFRGQTLRASTIDIGDIPPRESVRILAWCADGIGFSQGQPLLTHESGLGAVTVDGAADAIQFVRP